jgi:stage II sporulation protein D (peptidoglycan lytic transglycosylase)
LTYGPDVGNGLAAAASVAANKIDAIVMRVEFVAARQRLLGQDNCSDYAHEIAMRRSRFLVCSGAAAFVIVVGGVPGAGDTVGRTIRVRLFKGRSLIRVDVSGPGSGGIPQIFSFDANTTIKPTLIGGGVPLTVTAYDADGLVASRRYGGQITVAQADDGILIVNTVDLEQYVGSVLAAEISPSWPYESIKAQAIAARTFALHASRVGAHAYDLGDDTSSQVYNGMDDIDQRLIAAAQATAGVALLAGTSPAEVFYSAACGGHTASAAELTGANVSTYLRGIADSDASGRAYCSKAPLFNWQNVVSAESMASIFDLATSDLIGVDITSVWPDGRARTIAAHRHGGADVIIGGRAFYAKAAGILGYKVIPSLLFQIQAGPGGYQVTGHGLGHGVGMCQWGARGRADAGMSAQAILTAYFPGTLFSQP